MKQVVLFLLLAIFLNNSVQSQHENDNKIWFISSAYVTNMNFNLDVQMSSKTSGTPVWLYSGNGSPAQKWRLTKSSGNYYIMTNILSQMKMAVKYSSTDGGGTLSIDNSPLGEHELWSLQDAGDGFYYVMSKINGYYLTVDTSVLPTTATGTRVYLTRRGQGNILAQKWRFTETQ